ncbi:MAG: hypothetical protein LWX70_01420 [Sphingobacteriia bacterium]|nr:hypothetical protein [Sphingobacteriia bacterium]
MVFKIKPILCFLLLVFLSSCSYFSFYSKLNQYDHLGRREGHWIEYWDDSTKTKSMDGYFKENREVKRVTYYYSNGKPSNQFKYRCRGRVKVKFWDIQGRLVQKGTSLLTRDKNEIHYRYHGIWTFYDTNGRVIDKARYIEGNLDSTYVYKSRSKQ